MLKEERELREYLFGFEGLRHDVQPNTIRLEVWCLITDLVRACYEDAALIVERYDKEERLKLLGRIQTIKDMAAMIRRKR